ncbi:hypothetical protein BKA63DRAFT_593576 [Paraphoma chrysanthemicola]|nr:hypothetical protein BKA63DRAFT_593576 [Paraphoma chrysanthemicola]
MHYSRIIPLTLPLAVAVAAEVASYEFPAFDDLPIVNGEPQGSLWGFFDENGRKDEIGTINILTPSVVQAASREIRSGEHVQLDWSLDNFEHPEFGRIPFQRRPIDVNVTLGVIGMDEELYFNTQSGSQWDSLKHYAIQTTERYYNGMTHAEAVAGERNGIHNWCQRGGIVGRGVLVDWFAWYEHTYGSAPSPVTKYEIAVEELERTLKWQGTRTRKGHILIVRSGYLNWYNNATESEREAGMASGTAIGVESSEKTVRWLYDRHFAAVASDSSFEAVPFPMDGTWAMHDWLLVHWGTPIGEHWNLEELADVCKRQGRWTFFLTSAPLHVKGGVASPPGAIAIF